MRNTAVSLPTVANLTRLYWAT